METIVINIEQQQRFTRRFLGIIFLILAFLWSGIAILSDWDLILRSSVFVFYALGFLLVIEAKNAVCVGNAILNRHGKTGWIGIVGQETIKDKLRSGMIRRIAVKEVLQAIIISVLATGIVLIFP